MFVTCDSILDRTGVESQPRSPALVGFRPAVC
jgi:hypothetical protein